MEALQDAGLVRGIGVSNHRVEDMQAILAVAKHKPLVNQVELHPQLPQPELVNFCEDHGIVVVAYNPLAPATRFADGAAAKAAADVASAHPGFDAPSVLLSWAVSRGFAVVTTSKTPGRAAAAVKAADGLRLTSAEVEAISRAGAREAPRRAFWKNEFGEAV